MSHHRRLQLEYRSTAAPAAREKRTGLSGELELRSDGAGHPLVVGYAAKWGKLSRPIGGMYQEKVQRGAFAKSLKQVAAGKLDLVATLNHDANLVLGRTGNGTLKVVEDEVGLRFEATPPETTWAADMLVQLKRKDHKGCSFAFECEKAGQRWDFGAGDGGMDVRTLVEVDLAEVAACTFPQYDDTTVALEYRSQAQEGSAMPTPRTPAGYHNGRPMFPAWSKADEAKWATAHPGEKRSCFHGHLGVWLMHGPRLTDLVALVRAGVLKPVEPAKASHGADEGKPRLPYELTDRGVAVLRIEGTMKKEASKFGGTGTVRTQRHLKAALRNADVRAIMLVGDSPGGHVDGTKELADLVSAAGQLKPVHSYAEDMACSACYWVLCQASRFTGNATGQLGSIGAVGVIQDTTGAFERDGVKVHVVATGPLKGAGTPGTPITDEHLAEVREYVTAVHGFFQAAVMAGRKMDQAAVDAVSDGRVWIAADAVRMGLLDQVETYEAALEACAVAGEQDALGMGMKPGGTVKPQLRRGGMTLKDAARRQRLAIAGTEGLGTLSQRMQALRTLDDTELVVLEVLADEEPVPPAPADDDTDDDDPALADPLDEPVEGEEDDEPVEAEDDDEPAAEEGDEEPEGDPSEFEEHPELGASADRARRQRQARAQQGEGEEPEAEGDDEDPVLEQEDELAEGTEDDEPPAAEEGEEDPDAQDPDEEPVEAEEGEEDPDAQDPDAEPVEAEEEPEEPQARNYDEGDPDAPEGTEPEDPGPDPDTSNPGQGDQQDTSAEGDDEAGELVEDDDDVTAEGLDDLEQGVSPDQADATRRRRQRQARRS